MLMKNAFFYTKSLICILISRLLQASKSLPVMKKEKRRTPGDDKRVEGKETLERARFSLVMFL